MNILIKKLDKTQFTLTVDNNATVGDLKSQVSIQQNRQIDICQLIYNGIMINDDSKLLSSYDIINDSALVVMFRKPKITEPKEAIKPVEEEVKPVEEEVKPVEETVKAIEEDVKLIDIEKEEIKPVDLGELQVVAPNDNVEEREVNQEVNEDVIYGHIGTFINHLVEFLQENGADLNQLINENDNDNQARDNLEKLLNDQDRANINTIVDMGFGVRDHVIRMYLLCDKNADTTITMYLGDH